ncbi:unknown [Brachyspira sp. CAG:700]|nr:unknown [Brachyspira sp. CAG:700]
MKVQSLPLTDGVVEDSTPRKFEKYFPNSKLSFIAHSNVSAALLVAIFMLAELVVVVPVEEKLGLEEEKLALAKLNLVES